MKEHLIDLVSRVPGGVMARNLAREYLQARLLAALQRCGAMMPLAFHGGTALRFLYGHARYSEDLDFSLERDARGYDLRRYLQSIRSELEPEGYAVDLKLNDRKTVQNAFVRFPGLLYELTLSTQPGELLSIKIEVDTNPPAGAVLETSVVRRHFILHLQHHDRASLLAGKLHALLQRPYPKGRDLYDLLWYLGDRDWPAPNLTLLNHALAQTGWAGGVVSESDWRVHILTRLKGLDWARMRADVRPFIEPSFDLELLNYANLETLLGKVNG